MKKKIAYILILFLSALLVNAPLQAEEITGLMQG